MAGQCLELRTSTSLSVFSHEDAALRAALSSDAAAHWPRTTNTRTKSRPPRTQGRALPAASPPPPRREFHSPRAESQFHPNFAAQAEAEADHLFLCSPQLLFHCLALLLGWPVAPSGRKWRSRVTGANQSITERRAAHSLRRPQGVGARVGVASEWLARAGELASTC